MKTEPDTRSHLSIMLLAAVAVFSAGLFSANAAFTVAEWDFDSQTLNASDTGAGIVATMGTLGTTTFVDEGGGDYGLNVGSAGGGFTIHIVSSGLTDYVITYEGAKTHNGPLQSWEWSADGIAYSTANITTTDLSFGGQGSYASYTVTFADAALNTPEVYFRNTLDSSGAKFDNIIVTAVPEPAHYALGLFGVIFVGARYGRGLLVKFRNR